MSAATRRPQVSVLGSAEPGSAAHALAAEAGSLLARLRITVVSGCGSPATRIAAERAVQAGGLVVSIVPPDEMPPADWPATVAIPSGMGDARNLLMALAGDACIVVGGRAGTISEVCLAWLHRRPLLPLVGHGGWSDGLPSNPPDERRNSPILPWSTIAELEANLATLGLAPAPASAPFRRDTAGETASMPDDERQIRALVERWGEATRAGDVGAVLDLMTDDVVFLLPGRAPMSKAEFAAASAVPAGAARPQMRAAQRIREIQVAGNQAFLWSELEVAVTPPGAREATQRSGHTLSIFRREGGRWRLARDANLLAPNTGDEAG